MASCQECKEGFKLSLVGNGGTNGNHKFCSEECLKASTYRNQRLRWQYRVEQLTGGARTRAKKKGVPFDITTKYMKKLYTGKCDVTDTEFDLTPDGSRINKNAPSIDRICPELGYVKGNVRFVTAHLNVAMSEYGLEALQELAKRIN